MNTRRILSTWIILLLLSFVPLGEVLAKELRMVYFLGPGSEAPIKTKDPQILKFFSELRFVGRTEETPTGLETSYIEIGMSSGEAMDVYHYYPSLDEGPGYFYYADVRRGWSSAEGSWFMLSEDTDRELRQLLINLGVSLFPTEIAGQPNGDTVTEGISQQRGESGLSSPNGAVLCSPRRLARCFC